MRSKETSRGYERSPETDTGRILRKSSNSGLEAAWRSVSVVLFWKEMNVSEEEYTDAYNSE